MQTLAPAVPLFGCPDPEVLSDFNLGKLSPQDLDAVALHASSCPRCEQVLHDLHDRSTEDSIFERLKRALEGASFPDGPTDVATGSSAETISLTSPQEAAARGLDGEQPLVKEIGQYEVLGKIGHGGMGVIYRVRQVPLNRLVALKVIRAGPHAGDQAIARFHLEGKAVARLRHPNVVQVYDFGECDGLPYYSMELVEGGNLQAKLAAGPLTPREAAELVRTLATAIEYAHLKGVVHRDLKPSNILLAEDGTPKITDFGLAKLLDSGPDGPTAVRLTETYAILGTASYMAPEQAEGLSSEIGAATDIYALGALLYECLTGQPPFSGGSKVKTLELVRSAEPVPPSRHRPGIPSWLEAICLKCLEKSPSRRYPSAQALADDLGRWLDDQRPRDIPSQLTKLGRRLRRHAAALLIASALVPAGVVLYLSITGPQRAVQRIEREPARGQPVTLIGKTGKPEWSQWRNGKSEGQSVLADDNTLSVQSWMVGLLELVPDPQAGSYRFTAQIRHDMSADTGGEVGLYFARREYLGNGRQIHFFTHVSFNAVRGDADLRARVGLLPGNHNFRGPPRKNAVQLFARLLSDEAMPMHVDRRLGIASGPQFESLGQRNGRWHDLEVIVTPARVTARWNGESFSAATADIQKCVETDLTMFPPSPANPLPRGLRPMFEARGGLGLYVRKGSASFRAVTVTPLRSD